MFAERIISETDMKGCLKTVPVLPPNTRFEVIFLSFDVKKKRNNAMNRVPHPDICGKMTIMGDIINSVPESLWDLPK
jgi:hypothetical protein